LPLSGAVEPLRAWQDSQSLGIEITSAVSGSPTDDVTCRNTGGGISLAVGLHALIVRR